jgi:hypothetical protein
VSEPPVRAAATDAAAAVCKCHLLYCAAALATDCLLQAKSMLQTVRCVNNRVAAAEKSSCLAPCCGTAA